MKKKKIILIVLLAIISPIILLVLLIGAEELFWKLNFDKFNYESAKENTIKYFYENEDELEKLLNKTIKEKNEKCIEKPYKKIDSICYHSDDIIEFNMDAQGMLGGQYYGLKYNTKAKEDLIIYDEYKETGNGNNIFIAQRIKGNWFFYYRDWDGKVDTSKIKE